MTKKNSVRGRVEEIKLKRSIRFNSHTIKRARIEIDHINYGLDKKTKKLNKKRRTDFTIKDIEKFILLLDEEVIMPRNYKGKKSEFELRINCPIKGKFFDREFIMIFDTDYNELDLIHTITLIPGW